VPVLKARKRIVSLRLSDDEYQRLVELCPVHGAHSISDMARTAVCSFLVRADEPKVRITPTVAKLQAKVGEIEDEVRRLSSIVSPGAGMKD